MTPNSEPSLDAEKTKKVNAPVILYATFTTSPNNADTIAALLNNYAAKVRKEPSNRLFEATCKQDEPESFFVYEEYTDDAAFQAHLNAPYGAPFNAALAPLIAESQSMLTFLLRI